MNVTVHIERLVLDGLPLAGDAHGARLGAAVEAAMTRLIAEHGVDLHSAGVVPKVSAGGIDIAAHATPERVGAQIARAVHSGLTSSHAGDATAPPARRGWTGR